MSFFQRFCAMSCLWRPDDPEWMMTRKTVIAWVAIFVCFHTLFYIRELLQQLGGEKDLEGAVVPLFSSIMLNLFVSGMTLSYLILTKSAPHWFVETCCASGLIALVLSDYVSYVFYGTRKLGWLIIIVDVCLLCEVPRETVIKFSLTVVFLWQVIVASDKVYGYGLYDIEHGSYPDSLCSCEDPPCKREPDFFLSEVIVFGVYLLDYIIKRRFQRLVRDEKDKLLSGVELSRQVVDSLVQFDLQEARRLLELEKDSSLYGVLNSLIDNLERYKPYLPDSLFCDDATSADSQTLSPVASLIHAIHPPGEDTGLAAIVFTDIKSSTALWEALPEDMPLALQIHNAVIRKIMHTFGGYEVKTIGDSFMIAFSALQDACSFALEVQEQLPKESWPGSLGPNDVRVRISAHYGEVSVEQNSLTSRFDYFGSTVNRASRMEGSGVAGTVTVTEEQLCLLSSGFIRIDMGSTSLRGFKDQISLVALLPESHKHLSDSVKDAIQLNRSEIGDNFDERFQHRVSRDSRTSITSSASGTQIHVRVAHKKTVTVAECYISIEDHPFQDIRSNFSVLLSNLGRTSGTVIALYCTSILVTWNTARECNAHLECAMRFCDLILCRKNAYASFTGKDLKKNMAVGVSCGAVMRGEVGNATLKFISVIGSCVSLCKQLCESADVLGVSVLHAPVEPDGYCADSEPTLAERIRPVDQWKISGRYPDTHLPIYQYTPDKRNSDWGWSKEYWEAFVSGNVERITQEASRSTCTIFRKVAKMLSTNTSLRESVSIKHHYQTQMLSRLCPLQFHTDYEAQSVDRMS